MATWDFPKFYLDGALVECTVGPKPVCVALLDEDGGILLNCYVVPNGAVTSWNTQSTNLKSFNDLLECNPVHLEQVVPGGGLPPSRPLPPRRVCVRPAIAARAPPPPPPPRAHCYTPSLPAAASGQRLARWRAVQRRCPRSAAGPRSPRRGRGWGHLNTRTSFWRDWLRRGAVSAEPCPTRTLRPQVTA